MEPFDVRKTVYSLEEMRDQKIVYITDVEGNDIYFEHVIKISQGLFRDSQGALDLRPNYHFVYGGDVCDRGKGDLRIATDIVQLAKKYPDRVHLILGNRDINKLRFCTELQTNQLKKKLDVFWVDAKDIHEEGEFPCTPATRLHTILECTMGAPQAFQYREKELLEMGIIQEHMTVEEKEDRVVNSYVTSMEPGGCMLEFLRLGTLGLVLGDVFFFHGGVHEASLGWVPPSLHDEFPEGYRTSSVQDWCQGLALFHRHEMTAVMASCYARQCDSSAESIASPTFNAVGGYQHSDAGSRLMQYGLGSLPDGSTNPTLIYDNFLVKGAPQVPSEKVISFLSSSGVKRTVTGHQPHGDAPVVITTPSLQFLTGDTSYAANVEWDLEFSPESVDLYEQLISQQQSHRGDVSVEEEVMAETRGCAVSEIVIQFSQDSHIRGAGSSCSSQVVIHGVTQALFSYEFSTSDEYIGRRTADGWWVKSLFHLGSSHEDIGDSGGSVGYIKVYMLSKSAGRSVFNTLATAKKLKGLFA